MTTLKKIWTDRKPDLSHLRVFGYIAYAQLAREQREKLNNTFIHEIFVRYTSTSRQYRVYDLTTR
jgi:hypothetical protein